MSGSMKNVVYNNDGGDPYCIKVDESNIEMIMGAQVPASGAFRRPPQGFKVRFVRVESQDGLVRRTIPVLNLARFVELTGTTALVLGAVDSDSGLSVRVSTKTAEKQRNLPRSYDTGRLDGDTD